MIEQRLRQGQPLGRYRLVHLLGQGGFADVYLGEHIHLHTHVAVKVLQTKLADEDVLAFKREAQTVARLLHPNIVRVLDFGVEDTIPYLVMDYAPNGTLRNAFAKGSQIPLPTVVSFAKQVAEALQYAHDQRLIHRDIKPENMLLGRNGEELLSDFGIALVQQSSRSQSAQNIAGTIAYMAPEQIQAHPCAASVQYALGIVVYEWLCGTRLVSTASDQTAKVWQVSTGTTLYTYNPPGGAPIGEASWSHNDRTIAVYGGDANIYLLDALTGKVKGSYFTGVVYSLSWSPDDTRIVTGSYNKVAQIWRVG